MPVGGEHSLTSNVTIVFDQNEDVVQYSETLLERNSADNFRITVYTDGELTKRLDTNLSFMPDSELVKDLNVTGATSNSDPAEGPFLSSPHASAATPLFMVAGSPQLRPASDP